MGRTELSSEEKDRRLNVILNAAKRVFLKRGYFKATMADIALESKISRRTIYLYFKNKDEISHEVVRNAFAVISKSVNEAADSEKSGYDRLLDIKDAYVDYYNSKFADLVFTMFFDFRLNTKNLKNKQIQECFSYIAKITGRIEDCIKLGIEDGSIRNTIEDPRRVAIAGSNIIHATMQKLAVRVDVIESVTEYKSQELIDEMFDLFFRSIKA